MAFGPLYTELPLAAATATRPATRYVDETSWSALIGNFSLWQDNVNGNAKTLSNVVLSAGTAGSPLIIQGVNSAGSDSITGLYFSRAGDAFNDTHDIVWGDGSVTYARLSCNIASSPAAAAEFTFFARAHGAVSGFSNEIFRINGGPQVAVTITGQNASGADAIAGILFDRVYGSVGDSMDLVWGAGTGMTGNRTARIQMAATAAGEAGFIFHAQTAAADGYSNEVMRIQGNGEVHFGPSSTVFMFVQGNTGEARIGYWNGTGYGLARIHGHPVMPELASSNPGAGSKRLYYDPADGNRVKYAA